MQQLESSSTEQNQPDSKRTDQQSVRFQLASGEADANQQKQQLKRSVSIEPFDLSCKVLLIGDSGVGKTCYLHQFKDGKFPGSTYIATVGVDYRSKTLPVDGFKVRFQMWDTAGTERYRSITSAYYRDADSVLLLYDLTNRQSFNNVRAWLTDIREYGTEDAFIILLANKADLQDERQVHAQEGQRLAQENGITCFMETSAKTGCNIDLCHQTIGRQMLAKQNLSNSNASMRLSPSNQTNAKLGQNSTMRGQSCKACSVT